MSVSASVSDAHRVAVPACAVRAEAVGVGTIRTGCKFIISPGSSIVPNTVRFAIIAATLILSIHIMAMRTRPIGRTAMAVASCGAGGCTVAVAACTASRPAMVVARHFGSSLGVGGAAAGGAHRVGTGSAHDKLALDALPCAADKACRAGGVVAGPVPDSLVVLFPLGSEHLLD